MAEYSFRIYQIETDDTSSGPVNIVGGSIRRFGSQMEQPDMVVEEMGSVERSVEHQDGTYKLGEMTLKLSGLQESYFKNYEYPEADGGAYRPYVVEVREGPQSTWDSNEVLFHGIADVESVKWSASSERFELRVWAWDRVIKKAGDIPARSIYEVSVQSSYDIELVKKEEIYLKLQDNSAVGVGDTLEYESKFGTYRAVIEDIKRPGGKDIMKAFIGTPGAKKITDTPVPMEFFGNGDKVTSSNLDQRRDTILFVWNPTNATSGTTLEKQAAEALDVGNLDADNMAVTLTGTNGSTVSAKLDSTDVSFGSGPESSTNDSFVSKLKFEAKLSSPKDLSGLDAPVEMDFDLYDPIDETDTVDVYGEAAYGYAPPSLQDDYEVAAVDSNGNPTGLIPAIFSIQEEPQLDLLSAVVDTFTFDVDQKVDRRMTFPEKLDESLHATLRTAPAYLKANPTKSSGGSEPRVEVEVVDRRADTEQAVSTGPGVVKRWNENVIPQPLDAVKITTQDVGKPDDWGDLVGWHPRYNNADGEYKAPDDQATIEIETVAWPAFEGTKAGQTHNDKSLRAIAEYYYEFFKQLGEKGRATLDGVFPDLAGGRYTFDVPEYETSSGTTEPRTVYVTKSEANLVEEETKIEFRRGEFVEPSTLFLEAKASVAATNYIEDPDATETTVAFDAQDSIAPAGSAYEWKVDYDNDGTFESIGQQRIARRSLSTGSYDWKLIVTAPDGTSDVTTGTVVVEREAASANPFANVTFNAFEEEISGDRYGVIEVEAIDYGTHIRPTAVEFFVSESGNLTGSETGSPADSTTDLSSPAGTRYRKEVKLAEGHISEMQAVARFDNQPDAVSQKAQYDAGTAPDPSYSWEWEYDESNDTYDLYLAWAGSVDTASIKCDLDTGRNGTTNNTVTKDGRNGRVKLNSSAIDPTTKVDISPVAYSETAQSGVAEKSPSTFSGRAPIGVSAVHTAPVAIEDPDGNVVLTISEEGRLEANDDIEAFASGSGTSSTTNSELGIADETGSTLTTDAKQLTFQGGVSLSQPNADEITIDVGDTAADFNAGNALSFDGTTSPRTLNVVESGLSGVDADLLDGVELANISFSDISASRYTDGEAVDALQAHDGTGVDADTLDGVEGSNYARTDVNETFNNDVYVIGGNVGLGTTSPSYPLEVNGSSAVNKMNFKDSQDQLQFPSGSNDEIFWMRKPINNSAFAIYNKADEEFRFYVGEGGNVGIGTTSPSYALDVSGTGNFSSDLYASGNVGIGTISPSSTLDVRDSFPGELFKLQTDGDSRHTFSVYFRDINNGTANRGPELRGWNDITVLRQDYGGNKTHLMSNGGIGITSDSKQNVGIGTTSPFYTLDVNGTGNFSSDLYASGNVGIGTTSPGAKLDVVGGIQLPNIGNNGEISFRNASGSSGRVITVDSSNSMLFGDFDNKYGAIMLRTGSNDTRLYIGRGGNVGIGTISPDTPLEVDGGGKFGNKIEIEYPDNTHYGYVAGFLSDGTRGWYLGYGDGGNKVNLYMDAANYLYLRGDLQATGEVESFTSSDRRLKDNLAVVGDPMGVLSALSGYRYEWNDEAPDYKVGRSGVGLIAQEVQDVLPEAVRENASGYLGLQYEQVIPVLVEALKEQQERINELESQMEA